MKPIYLDHAATTPIDGQVRDAMAPFQAEEFGNPSARHAAGQRAAAAIEKARRRVARATGVDESRVVFTSGGTEANNLGVIGLARAARDRGRHVLFGPTEHPCVRNAALALGKEGFEAESFDLVTEGDDAGELDLADAERRLRPDTVLATAMVVNNEVGSIYAIAEFARLVRTRAPEALVHVDAVQAVGKIDVTPEELGVDSLALSAHKLHGPKGVGALILGGDVRPEPLLHGGGQEHGLRSGTENVAGIVGAGKAVQLAVERLDATHAAALLAEDALRTGLAEVSGAELLEASGTKVPSICAVRVSGPPAEVYQHHLEARGVYVSVGSACQSKEKSASPALLALGLAEDEARQVLRFSFAYPTTPEEVHIATRHLKEISQELARPVG